MRKENWLECLNKYLGGVFDKPFEWGVHDCCIFCNECVKAMTGEDFMTEFVDYSNETTAKKALNGTTLYMTIKKKFGKPVPTAMARRGDLMYKKFDTGPALGICVGRDALFVGYEGKDGLVTVPTLDCEKAFRV